MDEGFLKRIVRQVSYDEIQKQAKKNDQPILCIIDNNVCRKTKPSSQAVNSIEGASCHYSSLDKKKVYSHAVVQAMLSTGDSIYPFATERYVPQKKQKKKQKKKQNKIINLI